MPIDRKKYHPKWSLISYLIRFVRAKNRCEDCGIKNYSVVYYRDRQFWSPDEADTPNDGFSTYMQAKAWADEYNDNIGELYDPFTTPVSVVKLSVAHLDHNIKNNRFWNLKCKCQWCHLGHDRKDNAQKRMYGPTGRHHKQLRLDLTYEDTGTE